MVLGIDDLSNEYFDSTYRLEWFSEILGRKGIIPTVTEEMKVPDISIDWNPWEKLDGSNDVQKMSFTFKKDNDVDYAGRILIKCSELNSKAFIEGMNNFIVEVRALSIHEFLLIFLGK